MRPGARVTPSTSGSSSIVVPQPALVVSSVSRDCGWTPAETRKRVRLLCSFARYAAAANALGPS